MKKIFTLIAVAVMAMGVNAQTKLIDFPTSSTGIAVVEGGTALLNGKVTANGTEYNPTIQFKNSEAKNGVELTTNGGFKAGDVVTLSVVISNSDETKKGQVEIHGSEKLFTTTEGFNAALEPTKDPVPESYTLTEDVEKLVLARSGNTGTHITALTVTRGGGSAEGAEVWSATDLNLDTDITSRENTSAGLKKVPEQYPGAQPDTDDQIKADATGALTLTDYIFTAQTANVTLTGVSTPNSDQGQNDAWRFQGPENQYLNLDACPVKFTQFIQSKTGNPTMESTEYFFTNSEGNTVGPRYVETYWEPGCGQLPAKGEYYEVSFKTAGTFLAGVFVQRPTSNLYVLDKETIQLLAPSAITFNGYNNNNTVDQAGTGEPYMTLKLNDDYTIAHVNSEVELNTGKPVFGFISFSVEAGKTYLMFNPKNQLGLYGFQFTEGGSTNGVETITANKVWNVDAPMYNLAGQKVDKSYKGIVIQNGRKFYNK